MLTDFVSLIFPHTCSACGNTLFKHEKTICTSCLYSLPKTNFHLGDDTVFKNIFTGRLHVEAAVACYYFIKGGRVQALIHQLKYRNQRDVGVEVGRWYGNELKRSGIVSGVNVIIPVPLHRAKKKQRGYNQSEVFAQGLAASLHIPVDSESLVRVQSTESQTTKKRFLRWQNVETVFQLNNAEHLQGKHILLVDDVVTTGATLEASALALADIKDVKISIATIAFARH
jgi:ComF family protein